MEQRWLTAKIKHEGFPRYLRKPDYKDIWILRDKFPVLLTVTHKLRKVDANGIPDPDYNESLGEFDNQMTRLLRQENEGVIALVETFGGERNYYYFVTDKIDYEEKIKRIKETNKDVELEIHSRTDKDWDFIKQYPTKLY